MIVSVSILAEKGGSQNGRLAEILNAAAKDNLPFLMLTILDSGRAINTFTPDIAKGGDDVKDRSNVYLKEFTSLWLKYRLMARMSSVNVQYTRLR